MIKQLLTLLLFITTLTLTGQTNLVPNGDMENWDSFDTNPDDWFRFLNGFWEKSSDFQNTASSVQLEIDTGRTFMFINTPNMQFTNGTTYICTFYYKVVSGNLSKVEFNLVHTPSVFPQNLVVNEFTDLSTTVWKKGEFEFTSSTTENVQGFIYARGNAGSKVLIDNVSIYDISTLSISDFSDEQIKLSIYPNPATTVLHIDSNMELNKITVYNLQGQKLSESTSNSVNVESLANGLYLLEIENTNKDVFTKRFIKQ